MKKTNLTRSLLAACSIVALSAVMYGCVHSGDGPSVSDLDVTAPVEAGTYSVSDAPAALVAALSDYEGPTSVAQGESITIGGYTLTCTAGPCEVTLSDDEERFTVTGTISVFGPMAMMPPEPVDPEPVEPEPTAYEAAKAAIEAATTAAAAQAAYDAVDQTAITGAEAASLQMALNSRLETLATAARAAMQRAALMTAAGAIDTSDLSTADAIAAATAAINALQAAIDAAADVDDTSMYQSQVTTARAAVATAQSNLDTQGRMSAQRMAISNAVTMARTAVAGVDDDSTDSEVAAADSAIDALEAAIDGADDLPEGDATVASAQGTLDTLKGTLRAAKASRTAALEDAAEADAEAMAELGKDLHAALAGNATADTTALDNATFAFTATGDLMVTAAAGAGSFANDVTPPVATLEAGDSAGALGGWMGTNYAHTDTGTKVTNEAVVYTNRGASTSVTFATAGITVHTGDSAGDDLKGYVTLAETDADTLARIMGADFTHSGTQTHTYDSETQAAFTTRGTYAGAPGLYRCTGTCSSTNDGEGSPSALGGVWHFKPDAGVNAMTLQPDAHYLYYGWWVSKDKDGAPTAASAFTGRVGTPGDDTATDTDGLNAGWDGTYTTTAGSETLTGSATYAGHAAGKFAIDNPLDGTGDGGHFTADAMLSAMFSGDNIGITGTIDNFMANGAAVPWSVALHQASLGDDGAFATPATDDAATTDVDETMGTTWSIDGNSASRSGTWSGAMYDEAVTGDDDDGSNIPTTVTGMFYSEFSTIGRMVGAFGADKQ